MISISLWLTYLYILNVHKVIAVRIFSNVLPTPKPVFKKPFEAEVISKTCLLKPQRGPCRAGIEMFYFDNSEGACKTFSWGGCMGNGNRYDTEEECQDKCLSKKDGPKRAPKWCTLTFDYGYCFGALERYYYDRVWQTCKKTIYSGCGGNRNNFFFKAQCESICLFRTGPLDMNIQREEKRKKVLIINPGPSTLATVSANQTTVSEANGEKDEGKNKKSLESSDDSKEGDKKNEIHVI